MLKNNSWILGFALFVAACSSGSGTSNQQIDYATLDSLQTEVALEIGESEDFLPGQLRSLVVTSNKNMLVADWASNTIEQFDANGNHLATVAQEGKGPGEMGDYFDMINTTSDTVLVNQLFNQKDFFVPGSEGIYQFVRSVKQEERPDRSFSIISAQSDTSYYATVMNVFSTSAINENEDQNYKESGLVVVNSSGKVLQDSVQIYKDANPFVQRSSNSVSVRTMPYRLDDDVVVLPNHHYLIARIDSNAIFEYTLNHQLEKKIPLNVAERPITSDDLDYKLGDLDSGVRNKIEARIGEYKPLFFNVYATEKNIWLHTDTSEKGKEMVVLDYTGNAIGKFMLPEVDDIQEIRGNRIYTIHRSPEKGDLIRVYGVKI